MTRFRISSTMCLQQPNLFTNIAIWLFMIILGCLLFPNMFHGTMNPNKLHAIRITLHVPKPFGYLPFIHELIYSLINKFFVWHLPKSSTWLIVHWSLFGIPWQVTVPKHFLWKDRISMKSAVISPVLESLWIHCQQTDHFLFFKFNFSTA